MADGMELMKISVVIPMYNSENTILHAIESVRNQTAFKLISEIIIVNDGSTDNSFDIVQKYKNMHKEMPIKIIDKINEGASSARNAGMREAKCEYIALLDSDDVWLPHKIERQMEVLFNRPDIYFLGSNYVGGKVHIPFKRLIGLYRATAKDICWCNFPVTPSVIFKKEVIETVGYFDEAQKYGEDINYFQKIGATYNYYYLPEELVKIGINKQYFGESGLTSDLRNMHRGTKKNLLDMYKTNQISLMFYYTMRIFYELKYYRRIVIDKIRKNKVKEFIRSIPVMLKNDL